MPGQIRGQCPVYPCSRPEQAAVTCQGALHSAVKIAKSKPFKNYPRLLGKIIIKEKKAMDKYRCQICGYIYDPEAGDSSAGVPAGTSFEDLPDDWKCPICGASKDNFEKE